MRKLFNTKGSAYSIEIILIFVRTEMIVAKKNASGSGNNDVRHEVVSDDQIELQNNERPWKHKKMIDIASLTQGANAPRSLVYLHTITLPPRSS
jgi:hypothetical protein